ncbi:hypothetical protein VTL71DRAFT_4388 [Oculimacula yallundae]|uniref:Uncharacterized protein n=1 Tax=Oculimacula yallundae TaxID=86028 RepID=A0ABR4C1V4_9HELO
MHLYDDNFNHSNIWSHAKKWKCVEIPQSPAPRVAPSNTSLHPRPQPCDPFLPFSLNQQSLTPRPPRPPRLNFNIVVDFESPII